MPGAHESAAASRSAKKEHARVERASRMVVCASLHGTSRPHVVAAHLQSKAIIVARPVVIRGDHWHSEGLIAHRHVSMAERLAWKERA